MVSPSLQDKVPDFPLDTVLQTIKEELGRPASELFESFNPVPLAAASLGQVHRAVSKDGKQLAIKIQRPGLKAIFDTDLKNINVLAKIMVATTLSSTQRDRHPMLYPHTFALTT